MQDLADRKPAEPEQTIFRTLFESSPGSFLVLEPLDYAIVAVSDAYLRATMTKREDIIGRHLFDVFPDAPGDPEARGVRNVRASLERVKTTRRPDVMAVHRYPIPRPVERGGGFEERWWSPINSPVFGPTGEMVYIIHRGEDVTSYVRAWHQDGETGPPPGTLVHLEAEIVLRGQELQRANEQLHEHEERLQAANRDLDDFAAIVSHDLKSPLRGVATLARWLATDYADKLDAEGREHLAEMLNRVARMDRMIDGILQYSRLGRTQEEPEPVAVAEIVAEVVRDANPPAHVRVRIAPDLPVVSGDPVRLRQVFQNLFGNAIQHANQPQVEIGVDWADRGSFWEFRVADNGPGIEERHFERIFKMFQTLAPKDKTDSTGIGLALIKRIVEYAGGQIRVESRMGEGSTFSFTWPKEAAPPPPPPDITKRGTNEHQQTHSLGRRR